MDTIYSALLLLALGSVSVVAPPPIIEVYGGDHHGKDCYKVGRGLCSNFTSRTGAKYIGFEGVSKFLELLGL